MPKPVYALVGDFLFATKIVKTAQSLGLEARTFDSADHLVQASQSKEPAVVILDCQKLEKEAFALLGRFRSNAGLSKVPFIGYLSHQGEDLKKEMRAAGCLQVYNRSEFTRELENLLGRYGHGFSSRI